MISRNFRIALAVLLLAVGAFSSPANAVAMDPSSCVRGNGAVYPVPHTLVHGYVVNNHCGGHFYARLDVDGRYTSCQYVGATNGYFVHLFTNNYYTVQICSSGKGRYGGSAAAGCGHWLQRIVDFGYIVYVGRNECTTSRRLQANLSSKASAPHLGCQTVAAKQFAFWGSKVVDNAKIENC